jgi:hypothetical protein
MEITGIWGHQKLLPTALKLLVRGSLPANWLKRNQSCDFGLPGCIQWDDALKVTCVPAHGTGTVRKGLDFTV